MPKLDSQGRIRIPLEFRDVIVPDCKIAICLEQNYLLVLSSSNISDEKVLFIRNIDNKGRVFIPKEALKIIDASKDTFFIVYRCKNKIYIVPKE